MHMPLRLIAVVSRKKVVQVVLRLHRSGSGKVYILPRIRPNLIRNTSGFAAALPSDPLVACEDTIKILTEIRHMDSTE